MWVPMNLGCDRFNNGSSFFPFILKHKLISRYTDKIREEYEKTNAFDQSSTYQIMKKYRKIILCKDCRHRAKLRDDCYRCRKATSLLGTLEDYDGCSRGEEKC